QADAVLVVQVQDLVGPEPGGAFRWSEPVGVEPVGDLPGAVPGFSEFGDPGQHSGEVGQLVHAGDRPDRLTGALVSAGPADRDVDEFAVPHDRDGDLLDHGTQDLFAIIDAGRGRVPEGGQVIGQSTDRVAFAWGEGRGAGVTESLV